MTDGSGSFASTPAGRSDRVVALVTTGVLLVAFIVAAPFAKHPWLAIPGFMVGYDGALAVIDLITAVLLYAQYRDLRRGSLLALACAYAFTSPLIVAHALSFPDAFVPANLIGGAQTTAWLWLFWHNAFPLYLCVYGVLAGRERRRGAAPRKPMAAGPLAVCATVVLALACVALAITADRFLPAVMSAHRQLPAASWAWTVSWVINLVALLVVVLNTRFERVLDIWVSVTLVAAVIDIALSAVLLDRRYQVGFYAGRIYGLLASSFVLLVLLRTTFRMHSQLSRTWGALRESERQLAAAIENAPIPMVMLRADGRVLQLSKAWREEVGDDVAGHAVGQRLLQHFAGGASFDTEVEAPSRTGALRRWSLTASSPGRLSDGDLFLVGMALDITERHHEEDRLRRERLAALNLMEDAILAERKLRELLVSR